MNYGNGFRFNHILNIFRDVIYEVYNHSKYGYGSGKRERINSYNLEEAYQEFTDELLENILKYQNAELIKEYLYTCFTGSKGSMGVVISIPGNLIVRGFKDAGFLLKLKYAYEKYQIIINKWLELDIQQPGAEISISDRFIEIQNEIRSLNFKVDPLYFDTDKRIEDLINEFYDESIINNTFHFEAFKDEFNELPTPGEKTELIKKRMSEFKNWKQQNEAKNDSEIMIALGLFIEKECYNFEELCSREVLRLTKAINPISRNNPELPIPESIADQAASYVWHATDTDMLELSIALLKAGIVRRTDGKKITHDEMTGLLENTFGCEIKDAKGKLSKAVARKKSVTPFLDSLKTAFEDYSRERDEN